MWLSRRGTRHQQKCSHCSSRGDTFPSGHTKPPTCEHCIRMHHVTPIQHCPFGLMLLDACKSYFYPDRPAVDRALSGQNSTSPHHGPPLSCRMDSFRSVGGFATGACRACGCGDNTVGHWTSWCVVPLMVVWIISSPWDSGNAWMTLLHNLPPTTPYVHLRLQPSGGS